MPSSILGQHAPTSNSQSTPTTMTSAPLALQQPMLREPPRLDDEAIAQKQKRGTQRRIDKKSNEYILKSFLAGGIAGCAVRRPVNPPFQVTR